MQLPSCVGRGKLPVNRGSGRIASRLHSGHVPFTRGCGRDAPGQTVTSPDPEFELGPVPPTARRGRIGKLPLLPEAVRLRRGKGVIERGGLVGSKIGQDHAAHLGLGLARIDPPFHLVGEGRQGALFRPRDGPPADLGLPDQEDSARAMAFVFLVIARRWAGLGRQGRAGVPPPLVTGLLKGHGRTLGIVRLGIQGQPVFPGGHHLPAPFWQTPRLRLPGLEGGLGRSWRTGARPRLRKAPLHCLVSY
jgi:hypothetical protein